MKNKKLLAQLGFVFALFSVALFSHSPLHACGGHSKDDHEQKSKTKSTHIVDSTQRR